MDNSSQGYFQSEREREREGGSVIADCITNPIYLILINASALQLILKIFKWKSTVD